MRVRSSAKGAESSIRKRLISKTRAWIADLEGQCLFRNGAASRLREHLSGRLEAAGVRELGEAHQRVRRFGERVEPGTDERPATDLRLDDAFLDELSERAPDGGPAYSELFAELSLGRQPVSGAQPARADRVGDR